MAAKLGIIAGSVSLLFLLYLPRLSRIAMRFGIPLFICIWPYSFSQLYEPVFLSEGVYRVLPNSSRHRIAIWDFAIEKVQQKPLTGWGANNSYVVPGADGYYDENAGMRIMPVYPHNFIIQVVLELGVIGLAVLAVVAHLLLRRWDAIQQPAFKATMGSCIIVYCVMSMSSFNVWHSWWMCVPVITCWLFYILSAKGDEPCSPART